VTGSLWRAVPGQLSLLELLEHTSGRNDPSHSDAATDTATERSAVEAELGEWERALLRFAAEHHWSGRYAERVQQALGCSTTRYLQVLAGLLDRPPALAAEPSSSAGSGRCGTAASASGRSPAAAGRPGSSSQSAPVSGTSHRAGLPGHLRQRPTLA